MKKERIILSLQIDPPLLRRIEALAKKLDRTRSWVARKLLIESLQKDKWAA